MTGSSYLYSPWLKRRSRIDLSEVVLDRIFSFRGKFGEMVPLPGTRDDSIEDMTKEGRNTKRMIVAIVPYKVHWKGM